jgi:hypothetical protein
MKNDVLHSGAHVDRFIIDNLREVRETVAALGSKNAKARTFGVADLWNIRRKAKSATARFY